jgi:hypothetical protein
MPSDNDPATARDLELLAEVKRRVTQGFRLSTILDKALRDWVEKTMKEEVAGRLDPR